jgi:hypothetical protein
MKTDPGLTVKTDPPSVGRSTDQISILDKNLENLTLKIDPPN